MFCFIKQKYTVILCIVLQKRSLAPKTSWLNGNAMYDLTRVSKRNEEKLAETAEAGRRVLKAQEIESESILMRS